jgi:sugar phosphate isomerase/epimerase
MQNMTRRQFLMNSAVGAAGAACLLTRLASAQMAGKIRVGACDWSMGVGGPEGLNTGKKAGLEGLEITPGGPGDKLKIADPEYRKAFKESMKQTGLILPSIAMGLLNESPFATESRVPSWMEQTIAGAKDLDMKVILVAFFGKGDLRENDVLKKADIDATVERLKEAAPKAKEAGIILGVENTLSAKQNLEILDRVKSDAVRVYYDIGNSTGNGYDVPSEIRLLGDRICQFHFKDGKNYLGQGDVKMAPVAEAIEAINYKGWVVLETSTPSGDAAADFKKNADYTRKLLKLA